MINYIINGATSFIGVALCNEILRNGDLVFAIGRETSAHLKDLPISDRSRVILSDLEHIESITDKISAADIFINLAWDGTDHLGRDNKYIQEKNVEYSLKAMQIAKQLGCSVFVDSGSQAEYGYNPDIISETSPCNPNIEYGKAKLLVWENGRLLCKKIGMKYIHLRIFSIFGENDHPWTLIMSCIDKMLKNEPIELTKCTQKWNFLYVGDAARMITILCRYFINQSEIDQEIYNIASKDTRVLRNFIEEMSRITKTHSEIHYGAISPKTNVSLSPSINKTIRIADINFTEFEDAINNIIKKAQKT